MSTENYSKWSERELEIVTLGIAAGKSSDLISMDLEAEGFSRSRDAVRDRRTRLAPEGFEGVSQAMSFRDQDEAFCAAMEAAGYVRRDPAKPEPSNEVPHRAHPAMPTMGSGWQI